MFVVVLVFFLFLFSPSFVGESSLSLLLFRFIVIFMGSIDVVAGDDVDDCFVAVVDVDDCFLAVGAVIITVVESFVVVVGFVLFSGGAIVDFFQGSFFPPFFLVTWVHPSSSFLLGFSG